MGICSGMYDGIEKGSTVHVPTPHYEHAPGRSLNNYNLGFRVLWYIIPNLYKDYQGIISIMR